MNNKSGIAFGFRGKFFKLVDFEWGKDNSFYFMPRQHDAQIGERITTEKDENGQLYLQTTEVKTGCFPTKKISRHPSGYLHIKDTAGRGGNREKDGLIGPSFTQMDGFYTFLVICPQSIENLVEVERPEPTDVTVNLPDNIEPFTVQFAVWDKKRAVKIPMQEGAFLGNGVVTLQIDALDHGLVMMFVNVSKASPDVEVLFPVRTCYIVR